MATIRNCPCLPDGTRSRRYRRKRQYRLNSINEITHAHGNNSDGLECTENPHITRKKKTYRRYRPSFAWGCAPVRPTTYRPERSSSPERGPTAELRGVPRGVRSDNPQDQPISHTSRVDQLTVRDCVLSTLKVDRFAAQSLPLVVAERFIGFRHPMGIFLLLEGDARGIERIE